jgi:sec-independent protein translocase protein TatB
MIPISDLIILMVLALLIFGPRRLPEIGRMVGKGLAEFRKASNELRRSINAELALEEDDATARTRRAEFNRPTLLTPPVPPPAPAADPAALSTDPPALSTDPPVLSTEPPVFAPARPDPAPVPLSGEGAGEAPAAGEAHAAGEAPAAGEAHAAGEPADLPVPVEPR